jgi:hypothetical protein
MSGYRLAKLVSHFGPKTCNLLLGQVLVPLKESKRFGSPVALTQSRYELRAASTRLSAGSAQFREVTQLDYRERAHCGATCDV